MKIKRYKRARHPLFNSLNRGTSRTPISTRKTHSAVSSASSGAGGLGDTTRNMMPSGFSGGGISGNWGFNRMSMVNSFLAMRPDTLWYMMWRQYWEARKIVNIPADDMIKRGWEYINPDIDPDTIKKIYDHAEDLKINKTMNKALQYERKYGGAVVVLGTVELQDNPEEELTPEMIKEGGLRFVQALGRATVTSTSVSTDLLREDYNRPTYFFIRGVKVHRSRVLVFDGGGQDDKESIGFFSSSFGLYRNDGFGISVLEAVYDDIMYGVGTRQAGMQLVNKASMNIFSLDQNEDQMITTAGDDRITELKYILDNISAYRGAILDNGTKLETYQSSFGSVPELIMTYLKVLSAASDIPVPRFLGEAPGGLNATGKGDLHNYYDSIHAQQEKHLKPQLNKLLPYLIKSATGQDIEGFTIEFRSLFEPTENEQADIANKRWDLIDKVHGAGIGDDTWAATEGRDWGLFKNDPLEVHGEEPQISEDDIKKQVDEAIAAGELSEDFGLNPPPNVQQDPDANKEEE